MNTNHQPYDLDVIDPIVVKEYRSPFRWIIPFVLGCLAIALLLQYPSFKGPHSTNAWLDYSKPTETSNLPTLGCFIALIAVLVALYFRRWLLTLAIIFATGYVFFLPIANLSKQSDLSYEDRFNAELPVYKQAIQTQVKYGAQFEEKLNGRTLTYWRWVQKSLSGSAEGVIYDPLDKLDEEREPAAFAQITKGHGYHARQIEPSWYYVNHY